MRQQIVEPSFSTRERPNLLQIEECLATGLTSMRPECQQILYKKRFHYSNDCKLRKPQSGKFTLNVTTCDFACGIMMHAVTKFVDRWSVQRSSCIRGKQSSYFKYSSLRYVYLVKRRLCLIILQREKSLIRLTFEQGSSCH